MDEFMSQFPVGSKIFSARMLADAQPRHCWESISIPPGCPLQHTCAPGRDDDLELSEANWKFPVVMRDGMRGLSCSRLACASGVSFDLTKACEAATAKGAPERSPLNKGTLREDASDPQEVSGSLQVIFVS